MHTVTRHESVDFSRDSIAAAGREALRLWIYVNGDGEGAGVSASAGVRPVGVRRAIRENKFRLLRRLRPVLTFRAAFLPRGL